MKGRNWVGLRGGGSWAKKRGKRKKKAFPIPTATFTETGKTKGENEEWENPVHKRTVDEKKKR